MNTMLRSSNAPTNSALAPSSLTTTGRPPVGGGGVHKGVWIGGGLMALTIVALATALVVRSNGSGSETAAPLASTVPTATAPLAGTPDAGAVPPATTVAQAPVAQAPAAQAPVQTAPVHATTTHHTATHSTGSGTSAHSGGGNTTVADAGGNGAGASPSYSEPARNVPPPVCTTCGTIDSYDAVKIAGQANGVGAVGGGAVGAVVGSQIAGRHNHTLGGVIGAIGGGLLGNEIEKSQRTTTVYDVHVRMDDGSMRTIRQSAVPVVGSKVTVQGNSIGARSSGGGSGNGGGTNYQSQPSGNGGSSFSPSGN
jgi:outer membrane lipoprotein SlyB